jgi:hypothetical protein
MSLGFDEKQVKKEGAVVGDSSTYTIMLVITSFEPHTNSLIGIIARTVYTQF